METKSPALNRLNLPGAPGFAVSILFYWKENKLASARMKPNPKKLWDIWVDQTQV